MYRSSLIVMSCVSVFLATTLCGCSDAGLGKSPEWRLAAATYTFRNVTFFESVDKTKALGLKYIEAFSWQKLSPDFPNTEINYKASSAAIEATKRKLQDAGVKLVNYYSNRIGKDEAETRKIFEFARMMGIETIVGEPEPAMLDMLDKLAGEYGVNLAIHNHPKNPKHPAYVNWNPDEVLKQINGRSKRIGTCADTGHWIRSGIDPVEALRKYDGRTICLHLKDIEKPEVGSRDVPWGTGVGNIKAILGELNRQKFSGVFSIEYEHNPGKQHAGHSCVYRVLQSHRQGTGRQECHESPISENPELSREDMHVSMYAFDAAEAYPAK